MKTKLKLTNNIFLYSVTNDDVQLQCDLCTIFYERRDRRQKRRRTFLDIQQFLTVSRVSGIFLSSLSLTFAVVAATTFSASAELSPTSEPQEATLSAMHKHQSLFRYKSCLFGSKQDTELY